MPEGSTESVRDLDLDEQVQQLVESIETTTRDITAPADEEHSDDAMDSPEDLIAHAAADESQEPETEAPTSAAGEAEEDFGEEAFLSPEEMTAEAATPAEPEAVDEPEVAPEPTPAPIPEPADSVEQVEAAMGQIDEAVDQLVENAVEAVEPESAPAPAPPPIPEPADAVEEVVEDVFEAPETETVTEAITEPVTEPVEAITEAINDENLDVVIEAPEDDDEKGPYDEFAIDGDFDSVEDDSPAEASTDDEDDIDDFGEITTEAPSPAPAEDAPEPEPEQAPEPAPTIAAAPKAKKPSPFAAMAAILAPLLEKAVVLVNAPVSKLSPSIRQFVGWSAINFAFLAAVILIVVVLRSMR